MQFFFRGLAAITYFLKLGHNNHGLHIYCSNHFPPTGHRNNVPSTGHKKNGPYMGRRHNGPSMGRIINGPYTDSMIDWPNMGQTDHILAVNGLELESFVHGPTITGHR